MASTEAAALECLPFDRHEPVRLMNGVKKHQRLNGLGPVASIPKFASFRGIFPGEARRRTPATH
jgi:hypothetical protein